MSAMRVASVKGPRDIRLEEAPAPAPGAGEALVRITGGGDLRLGPALLRARPDR